LIFADDLTMLQNMQKPPLLPHAPGDGVPPSCSVRTYTVVLTMLRATNRTNSEPSIHAPIGLRIDLSVRLTLSSMARRPKANAPTTLQATVAFALTALPSSDQVSWSPHCTSRHPIPSDCCRPKCTFIQYSDTLCAKSLAGYGHWSLCADISSQKSLWPSTLDGYPRVLLF
jgi:hypothetical protein